MDGIYMKYNITGNKAKVKINDNSSINIYGKNWVPVWIIAEYPKFLIAEVLPHENTHGYGISWPYRITLNKSDLYFKEIELKLT